MSPKNLNVSNKTHKNLLNKLRDKRIFQIYRKFENVLKLNQDFIVAVSGGSDSLALCFLTKIYSFGSGAVQVGTNKIINTTTKNTTDTGSAGIKEKASKDPPSTKSTKD